MGGRASKGHVPLERVKGVAPSGERTFQGSVDHNSQNDDGDCQETFTHESIRVFALILIGYLFARAADQTIDTFVRPHISDIVSVIIDWSVLTACLAVVCLVNHCKGRPRGS